ncbi:MAG TPA: patatin-like phospholipase family protein [Candidatus Binatia bacterium]|nr:patatin-like phospholipase family protein [Candidatus Binatia bacterium]
METTSPQTGGTVLVLGGGGGRGAAQIGILRALAERGIQPDACVGTSVGALNAAVVAALPLGEAVDTLELVWASPYTRAVFHSNPLRIAFNRLRGRSWAGGDGAIGDLVDFATGTVGVQRFEELRLPLAILVTDLVSGEPVTISRGPLRDPLRASCAIPFMYPPVRLGGRFYVDGGVTDNCSLSTAAAMNPSRIIAVDLTAEPAVATPRRWSEIFNRVTSVALHARVRADFDRFSSHLPVTLICPRIAHRLGVADFTSLRDAARAAMEALLATISPADGGLAPGVFYLPLATGESAGTV